MKTKSKPKNLTGAEAQALLRKIDFKAAYAAREARDDDWHKFIGGHFERHGVCRVTLLPEDVQREIDEKAREREKTDPIRKVKDQADAILMRVPLLDWGRFSDMGRSPEEIEKFVNQLHLADRRGRLRRELDRAPKRKIAELKVGDICLSRQYGAEGFMRVVKITHGGKRVLAVPHGKPEETPVKLEHTRWTSAVGTGRSDLVAHEVQVVTESFIRRAMALEAEYKALDGQA